MLLAKQKTASSRAFIFSGIFITLFKFYMQSVSSALAFETYDADFRISVEGRIKVRRRKRDRLISKD